MTKIFRRSTQSIYNQISLSQLFGAYWSCPLFPLCVCCCSHFPLPPRQAPWSRYPSVSSTGSSSSCPVHTKSKVHTLLSITITPEIQIDRISTTNFTCIRLTSNKIQTFYLVSLFPPTNLTLLPLSIFLQIYSSAYYFLLVIITSYISELL